MRMRGDWIQTFTGRQFFPLSPTKDVISIIDIAHALSMKCRYNGHCRQFYSVAEHCVYVARECRERWPNNFEFHLWGLLHDAGEAYLPDVPRPIKQMGVGIITECEDLIMRVVAEKYGIRYPEPKEIKVIDNAILATESTQVMGKKPVEWLLPEPPVDIKISALNPTLAESAFLFEFYSIASNMGLSHKLLN